MRARRLQCIILMNNQYRMSEANRQKRIERLLREIEHYKRRAAACANPSMPQEKRALTRVLHSLRRRESELAMLRAMG